MKRVDPSEPADLKAAISIAEKRGFGNVISHLKAAWAEKLVASGSTEDEARQAADTDALPIGMHRDIVDNGMWDETGEKYRA